VTHPLRTAVAVALMAAVAAGCTGDPSAGAPSPRPVTSAGDADREGPTFDVEDYRYTLTQSCWCWPAGRVRLVVRDGEVVSARFAGRRDERVPGRLRMSIDDLLARAAGDQVAVADVRWPDASPAPSRISLDHYPAMQDDEVTWTIEDFRVLDPVPTPIID
jgi:hypothetical protein